jgi:class 3 adenylate cyclase
METLPQYETRKDYSILFADIEGFSRLKPFQQRLFLTDTLSRVAAALHKEDHAPEQANTWGDGIVAFFTAPTAAIRCALTLRDAFRVVDWDEIGLPELRIRISLHAGEVYSGYNPVTRRKELIGTEVNRAARIEPIVEPNHVYVTGDFVNRCKNERARFYPLGSMTLAKGWGPEELFVAAWQHESISAEELRKKSDVPNSDDRALVYYPPSCVFGRRMSVSCDAKKRLAEYCARNGFWQADDVVFMESGTIPVYMLIDLYRKCDPLSRPKLLVTNNVACSFAAIAAHESLDESHAMFPTEDPMSCLLIGGRILDDYAATIPEDLIGEQLGEDFNSDGLVNYLSQRSVTHVIMMTSRFSSHDGPCAATAPMRRFKKLLMKYVSLHSKTRLTIVLEADKIAGRRGWAADSVPLPNEEGKGYWEGLLGSGRVTLIAAVSREMTGADLGLANRELITLQKAGVRTILLGIDGNEIDLQETVRTQPTVARKHQRRSP